MSTDVSYSITATRTMNHALYHDDSIDVRNRLGDTLDAFLTDLGLTRRGPVAFSTERDGRDVRVIAEAVVTP